MNRTAAQILLTIGLYAGMVVSLLLCDKYSNAISANDMSPGLEVAFIWVVIILFFFVRTVYLSLAVDSKYWLVAGVHLLLTALFMFRFMI